MPVQIWNQGRVVGYSAYEIYVKQHLSEHPEEPVATEREWLAASIGSGSSMILSLPNLSGVGKDELTYIDIQLPENSVLVAANTVVASFFSGSISGTAAVCYKNGDTGSTLTGGIWATKVTSYSSLVSNTEDLHPDGYIGTSGSIPADTEHFSDDNRLKLAEYMQIVDGIVIQPGYWEHESDSNLPYSDFFPQLYSKIDGTSIEYTVPRIRLLVKGPLSNNTNVLITGFTIRSVVSGVSREDGSIDPGDTGRHSENGDFLGPDVFPWANKIVFSVPMNYIQEFLNNTVYVRKLQSDLDEIDVKSTSVIDMSSHSARDGVSYPAPVLENYYNTWYPENAEYDMKMFPGSTEDTIESVKKSARISDSVNDFWTLGDGTCVLTVYQKSVKYPPALYGTFVNHEGQNYLHPIDVVAPGSVKIFNQSDAEDMQYYQDTFPGTTAVNINKNNKFEILDRETGEKVTPYDKSDHANQMILLGHIFQVSPIYNVLQNPIYMYKKPDTRSSKVSEYPLYRGTNYYNIESLITAGTDLGEESETRGVWLHVKGNVGVEVKTGWVRLTSEYDLSFENLSLIPFYVGPKYLASLYTTYDFVNDQIAEYYKVHMIVNPDYAGITDSSGQTVDIMTSSHSKDGVTYSDQFVGKFRTIGRSSVELFSKRFNYEAFEKTSKLGSDIVSTEPTYVNDPYGRSALVSEYPKVSSSNSSWLVPLSDDGNVPSDVLSNNYRYMLSFYAPVRAYSEPNISAPYVEVDPRQPVFSNSQFHAVEGVDNCIWVWDGLISGKFYLLYDGTTSYGPFESVGATWWNYPVNGQYSYSYVTHQNARKLIRSDSKNTDNFLGLALDTGSGSNLDGYQKSIQYSYESLVSPDSGDNETYSVLSAAPDYRGNNNISWNLLLSALGGDYAIDILQARLKSIQKSLVRSMSTGTGPYIEFGPASSPIRLYISKNEPETDDVPVGSIGIGWGFDN